MRKMMHPMFAAVCGLSLFLAAPAQATLTFTLERINGVTAVLTGVGEIEGPLPSSGFKLLNLESVAASVGDETDESLAGDFIMRNGGLTRDLLSVSVGLSGSLEMVFDRPLNVGFGPFGSATIILSGGQTWKPAGSSGTISWGDGVGVGMWSIVPEPSPALLLGLGLGGLAFIGRKPGRV